MVIEMGTEAHMAEIFALIRGTAVFRQKLERVKLGRWASWFNANRAWRGQKMPLLLVLCWMGIKRRWWRSWHELPMFTHQRVRFAELAPEVSSAAGVAPASEGALAVGLAGSARLVLAPVSAGAVPARAAAAASSSGSSGSGSSLPARLLPPPLATAVPVGPPLPSAVPVPVGVAAADPGAAAVHPRSVAESNVQVKKARASTQNTLHFVAKVLGDLTGNALAECVDIVTRPSCEFFDKGKTVCKTVSGSRTWHIWLADGGYDEVMRSTFACLQDPIAIQRMGFLACESRDEVDPATSEREGKVAQVCLHLCAHECFEFLLSTMTWSELLPGKFLLLLSPDPLVVNRGLRHMKEWWELLCTCEQRVRGDPWASGVLESTNFPMRTFDRELLVMLSEENFSGVTAEVQALIGGFADSWLSTNINEDCHNKYRSRSEAQNAGEFSREARWHEATTSDLISSYDRQSIRSTAASQKVTAGRPPDAVYVGRNEANFSLGHALVHEMGSAAYPRQSPQTMKLRGPVWLAIRHLDGDFAKLRRCWQSLLMSPGHIAQEIVEGRTGRGGLVIGSCPWGAVLWQVTKVKKGALVTFETRLPRPGIPPWIFVPVTNHADWKASMARVLSPCAAAESARVAIQMQLTLTIDKPVNLLEAAAKVGFKEMASYHLDKLLAMCPGARMDGRLPTREADKVRTLVRHCWPGATDAQVTEAMAMRTRKLHEDPHSVLLEPGNLDKIDHSVEEDDLATIKKHVEAMSKATSSSTVSNVRLAPASGPTGASAPAGDAAPAAAQWKLRPNPLPEADIELKDARAYMPPAFKNKLTKDVKRFSRWSAQYPREGTTHVTKSWGPKTGFTVKSALSLVLTQVWEWHTEATGERPEFDFSCELPA